MIQFSISFPFITISTIFHYVVRYYGPTVELRSNSTQFDYVSVYQLLKLLNYSGASVYLVVSPLSTDRGRIHDKFSSIRFWWSTFCCLWVMFAAKIVS